MKQRLLAALLGAIALVWLATAVYSYFDARHEIDELLERNDLTQEDKEAVLGGNALRFYRPAL